MKLKIEPVIFENYPEVLLAVIVLHNINNKGDDDEITQKLRSAEESAIERIGTTPTSEHPHIAPWREAYRKFGAKPSKYPSSIENLIKRVSSGEKIRHVNKLVDLYNIISLSHFVPVGGEDIASLIGDVLLTIATENEIPVKLLGEKDERPPYTDEVIYKDNDGTLCRRWNWKEAERTKLTEETKNAFIVMEGLPPVGKAELEAATEEFKELAMKFCGGTITTHILGINNPEVELE